MIRGFKHKGLARYFRRSDKRRIPAESAARIGRILDILDAATKPDEMNLPGYRFHELKGNRAGTYSVTVSGNVRITFAFDGEDATQVDLEDYH
jgi:proteic killer suppression protein